MLPLHHQRTVRASNGIKRHHAAHIHVYSVCIFCVRLLCASPVQAHTEVLAPVVMGALQHADAACPAGADYNALPGKAAAGCRLRPHTLRSTSKTLAAQGSRVHALQRARPIMIDPSQSHTENAQLSPLTPQQSGTLRQTALVPAAAPPASQPTALSAASPPLRMVPPRPLLHAPPTLKERTNERGAARCLPLQGRT